MEWLVANGYTIVANGYTFACSQRNELNGRDYPCLGRPVHENICCTDKFSDVFKSKYFHQRSSLVSGIWYSPLMMLPEK